MLSKPEVLEGRIWSQPARPALRPLQTVPTASQRPRALAHHVLHTWPRGHSLQAVSTGRSEFSSTFLSGCLGPRRHRASALRTSLPAVHLISLHCWHNCTETTAGGVAFIQMDGPSAVRPEPPPTQPTALGQSERGFTPPLAYTKQRCIVFAEQLIMASVHRQTPCWLQSGSG